MKAPSEMMSKNYCGPSKVFPLGLIRNEDGWRFIGIDADGGEHYCIVRKGDGGSFYMSSNTALFSDLIGFVPDTKALPDNAEVRGHVASRSTARLNQIFDGERYAKKMIEVPATEPATEPATDRKTTRPYRRLPEHGQQSGF